MILAIAAKGLCRRIPSGRFAAPLSTLQESNEETASPSSHRDIDWKRVLAMTAPENHDAVMKARTRHADLQVAITEAKEQPQGIDYEEFRKRNVDGALIASVRAAVDSYRAPKVDTADKIAKIQRDRMEAAKHSAEFAAQLETDIREMEAKLEIARAAKPPEEMTVDDVYEMYPELKEQIMEDIKRDNWGTSVKDMEMYAEQLRKEKEAARALKD